MSLASHGRCSRHKAINKKNKPFLYDKKHFLRNNNLALCKNTAVLRNSDAVYNTVLEVHTFTMYLYP